MPSRSQGCAKKSSGKASAKSSRRNSASNATQQEPVQAATVNDVPDVAGEVDTPTHASGSENDVAGEVATVGSGSESGVAGEVDTPTHASGSESDADIMIEEEEESEASLASWNGAVGEGELFEPATVAQDEDQQEESFSPTQSCAGDYDNLHDLDHLDLSTPAL